jgi:hypothetical protein
MSEDRRKLYDILVVCALRYGLTQDSRFALAALVTYRTLHKVLRPEAMDYVEGKLAELRDRAVATMPPQSRADDSYVALAAFIRSMGLAEALKGESTMQFDDHRAKRGLRQLAPELAKAIETCDLRGVHKFSKPEYAT